MINVKYSLYRVTISRVVTICIVISRLLSIRLVVFYPDSSALLDHKFSLLPELPWPVIYELPEKKPYPSFVINPSWAITPTQPRGVDRFDFFFHFFFLTFSVFLSKSATLGISIWLKTWQTKQRGIAIATAAKEWHISGWRAGRMCVLIQCHTLSRHFPSPLRLEVMWSYYSHEGSLERSNSQGFSQQFSRAYA